MSLDNFRFSVLALVGALLFQASADLILTNEEMQMMRDNNYTITVNEERSYVTYEHTGVPEHTSDRGWGNNHDAEIVNHIYTLPIKPTVASPKGCAGGLGVVGLAVSGAVFYNPFTLYGWDAVEGDCAEELDNCKGHPSPDGTYHYHGVPDCLYTGNLIDKFLGVALDGYPIYGPMDNTGKTWTSAELDECNGHTYNGRYMYRATFDFPYLISCFHGESVKITPSGPPVTNEENEAQIPSTGGITPDNVSPENGLQGNATTGALEIAMKCRVAKYRNWDTEICYVVCRNPGNDLDNCSENVIAGNTAESYTLSVIYVLTAGFGFNSFL